MLSPKEGSRLRNKRMGTIFEVKKITNQFVILESLDGLTQIMTEKDSLHFLFENLFPVEPPREAPAQGILSPGGPGKE